MKKLTIIMIIVILSTIGVFLYFNQTSIDKINPDKLVNLIAENDHGKEISFIEITDFEWETVYIVTPYMDPENFTNVKGMNRVHSSIHYNDSINLIVFVKANKAVKSLEISRAHGDFANVTRNEFNVDEATFTVDKFDLNHIILTNKY